MTWCFKEWKSWRKVFWYWAAFEAVVVSIQVLKSFFQTKILFEWEIFFWVSFISFLLFFIRSLHSSLALFLNRCLLTNTLPLINFFFFSFYYFSMTLFYLFKSFSSFQSIYLFSILLLSLHSFYYVIIFLIIVFLSFSLTYNIYSSRLVLQCHNPECKWHQTNSSFSLVPSCLEHQHFLLAFKFAPQDVIIMDSCRTPSNKSRCSDIKQVTLRLFAFIQPVIESFFSVHESYSAFLQSTKKKRVLNFNRFIKRK